MNPSCSTIITFILNIIYKFVSWICVCFCFVCFRLVRFRLSPFRLPPFCLLPFASVLFVSVCFRFVLFPLLPFCLLPFASVLLAVVACFIISTPIYMLVRQFPFTGGPPCCSFLSCSAVASHCFASIYFGWSSILQYFAYFLLFWSILLVSILLVLPFLFQAYFSRLSSSVGNVRVGCSCSEPVHLIA